MEGKPIELGKKYRDELTGWEGIATARHEYLFGCVRYSLERINDGKIETEGFDEQRLAAVDGSTVAASATSGGPQPAPPTRPTPTR